MAMPVTAAAFTDGGIDYNAVRLLVNARSAHPEQFEAHEKTLLDAARTLAARPLRMAIDYWRQALDEAGALDDTNNLYERRRLHVSATFQGAVRVDGGRLPGLDGPTNVDLSYRLVGPAEIEPMVYLRCPKGSTNRHWLWMLDAGEAVAVPTVEPAPTEPRPEVEPRRVRPREIELEEVANQASADEPPA